MQKKSAHLTHRTALAIAAMAVTPMVAQGQGSLAAQELIRRQAAVSEADNLLQEGRDAYESKDYQTAVDKYRAALDTLPYGTATTNRREIITAHLNDGAIALAQDNRRTGKYNQARNLLEEAQQNDPDNYAIEQQLEYLDDPIRTNPSLTYDHTQNVDKVRRYLYQAQGFYDIGRYDAAEEEFKNVLRIDPYNRAARRGLERCANIKSLYYAAAYDQTRAQMLMEVDRAWELNVPTFEEIQVGESQGIKENTGEISITEKLQRIILPVIDFEDATVTEAIDFLRVRSRELDTLTIDETQKGINFVVREASSGGGGDLEGGLGESADAGAARIDSLFLRNVPLQVALQYICEKAGLRYKVDEFAVTLLPIGEESVDSVITKTWSVPPTFRSFLSGGGDTGGEDAASDPFGDPDDGGSPSIAPRKNMKELLENQGITFGEGTSAQYLAGTSTLLVRNTPTQLERVEQVVEAAINAVPRQIKISTKFVEISQENTEELGFDWIVSPLGFGAAGPTGRGNQFFLGGGSQGNGIARNGVDFIPTVGAAGAATSVGGVQGGSQAVTNIVTAGNRSGDGAINRNSIDAILNNPNRTAQATNVAPGILSLTGIFSDGTVQMIMRGLSQRKGTDVMTAPSVMAQPGQKAKIEIIREFIYPTEYEPPELPNQVGGGFGGGGGGLFGGGGGGGSFPVTPATPTTFETKNTGVTLEIEPTPGQNDGVIDLRFAPEIIEFEGFVNYGSPITSPSSDALGNPVQVVITENRIEMPVFSVRRVETGITIYDGYTVAVGGLMREDVQNVEDKVPILGDLPFVGRLFQTKSENHIKSNLIIFVTAEIIDATGNGVRNSAPSTPAEETFVPTGVLPPVDGLK